MHIQWYPGHMTKAVRMMEENEKLVDAIIYVLDARAYRACFNPSFDKISDKPRLYVLNKIDTIPQSAQDAIVDTLQKESKLVVRSNSLNGKFSQQVKDGLYKLLMDKILRYKNKGVNKTVRAMVIGVPNSGKSTLINSLCAKRRADAQNRPGVTRGKQWIRLTENVELLDTPGTLWPSFENQDLAKHLAYIGCIRDDILDVEELAMELIKELSQREDFDFNAVFKSDRNTPPYEILESYGRSRGFLFRGGEVDCERSAKGVLDAFRKQKLGKICLEL